MSAEPEYWTIERLTNDADLDGLLEVEEASFSNPWTREMYVAELQNAAVSRVYVAKGSAGTVVGFCSFWFVFDQMHINNLAVLPEYRGRGLGTRLLDFILREASREGARWATLEVRRSNEGARRLYARMGFQEAGVRRDYYSKPVEDALILTKLDLGGVQPLFDPNT
jgi:ribosomal-protein-alanine N-acetyltransferase